MDGNDDWPEDMNTFEMAFAGLVYAVVSVALLGGAWSAYVVMWAMFG
jgi:hypothetical protein